MKNIRKGFTLLEILLVVAIIAILAGIVIVAINPAKQLGNARDAQRKSDINTIYKAANQYVIDHGVFPSSITTTLTPICDTGGNTPGTITCTDTIDLSALVPTYVNAIPRDPQASTTAGYSIVRSGSNIYVEAPDTEIGFTSQPGYSSTTPIVAFVGKLPTSYIPPAATGGYSGGGGGGGGGGFEATGGVITYAGGYKIHTFTSDGDFNIISGSANVEVLLVGGGGGGGSERAGGGAGGQIYYNSSVQMTAGDYAITVGQGGAGGVGYGGAGSDGGTSSIGDIYSAGGGQPGAGNSGNPGWRGIPGTGINGGGSGGYGSNGGGVNTPGEDGSLYMSQYWGGGGGGGGWQTDGRPGGAGGGGRGGDGYSPPGKPGDANTGGGGGGSNGWSSGGGIGGSGIVIIRYSN